MLTMRPPDPRCARAALLATIGARRLMWSSASMSSTGMSRRSLSRRMPALFTRMSRPPSAAAAFSNRPLHRGDLTAVGLNGDALAALRLDRRHDLGRPVGGLLVGDRNVGALGGQFLRDGGSDAAARARHERPFSLKSNCQSCWVSTTNRPLIYR